MDYVSQRVIKIDSTYLHIPIRSNSEKKQVELSAGELLIREFYAELTDVEPDWWSDVDVSDYIGKEVTITVYSKETPVNLSAWFCSDRQHPGGRVDCNHKRPKYHFSAARGWINDPNGLVFHNGCYHLFYQYNPYGTQWSNMHWGHAVSKDLVQWQEWEIALFPDEMGTMYSGSAISIPSKKLADYSIIPIQDLPDDQTNAIVIFYTAAGSRSKLSADKPFVQCIAYSLDDGHSFTKYSGNPIIPHIKALNRDPRIFWYKPNKHWVMVLFLDGEEYAIFTSQNLIQWRQTQTVTLPGCMECPDLFPITPEGDTQERWVFWGGNGSYLVGTFNGEQFHPVSPQKILSEGLPAYAAQTWNQSPEQRRIQISWLNYKTQSTVFNCFMTIPVELSLKRTDKDYHLSFLPVAEFDQYQTELLEQSLMLTALPYTFLQLTNPVYHAEIALEWDIPQGKIIISSCGLLFQIDFNKSALICREKIVPLDLSINKLTLQIYSDMLSTEIFFQDYHYLIEGHEAHEETLPLLLQTSGRETPVACRVKLFSIL